MELESPLHALWSYVELDVVWEDDSLAMELSSNQELHRLQGVVVMVNIKLAPHWTLLGHSMVSMDPTESGSST